MSKTIKINDSIGDGCFGYLVTDVDYLYGKSIIFANNQEEAKELFLNKVFEDHSVIFNNPNAVVVHFLGRLKD